jgi:hypothetical protein
MQKTTHQEYKNSLRLWRPRFGCPDAIKVFELMKKMRGRSLTPEERRKIKRQIIKIVDNYV